MWGWSKKASVSKAALEQERTRLSDCVEFLEVKRGDADTAYQRALSSGTPRARLRTLLEVRNSFDRRIHTAGRLQTKASYIFLLLRNDIFQKNIYFIASFNFTSTL